MKIERPADGTALALHDSTRWEDVAVLLALEEEQAEELEEYVRDIGRMPGVVIAGDLALDGDTTTVALARGELGLPSAKAEQVANAHERYIRAMEMEGYDGHHDDYIVVVLGDVNVVGDLEVVQYRPLYVAGDLYAKSVRGHTGNVVVRGALRVSEIVVWKTSEEGGLVWSPTIETPVMVEAGFPEGVWWQVDGQSGFDQDLAHLTEVSSDLLAQTVERDDVYVWLSEAIERGRGGEISAEYIQRRKAASTS